MLLLWNRYWWWKQADSCTDCWWWWRSSWLVDYFVTLISLVIMSFFELHFFAVCFLLICWLFLIVWCILCPVTWTFHHTTSSVNNIGCFLFWCPVTWTFHHTTCSVNMLVVSYCVMYTVSSYLDISPYNMFC